MQGARKRTAIDLCKHAQRVGFSVKWDRRNTLTPHSGSETVKHWITKALICRRVSELNDVFFTEVDSDRGVCDVLRFKLADERAIIYEVETGYTQERKLEKAEQYTDGFTCPVIQECFVIDPLDSPDSVLDASGWVEELVV